MLTVKEGMSLLNVQNVFNSEFPYLRLGFFRYGQEDDLRGKRLLLRPDLLLKSRVDTDQDIVIDGDMSVQDLERLFSERFGLLAQIFRKSGKSWLGTKLTNDWSLKKQNDEGFEISSIVEEL